MLLNLNTVLHTSGTGYWSTAQRAVPVTGMELSVWELRVSFCTDTWNTHSLGLIYSDPQFKRELAEYLAEQGITAEFGYSEQGMQGTDYVSFDVSEEFVSQYQLMECAA